MSSAEVVHIDTGYVRGPAGIARDALFRRVEVKAEADARLPGVKRQLRRQKATLTATEPPPATPPDPCGSPHPCEFWDRCTAGKPADWIIHLPRITPARVAELAADGIESTAAIPVDYRLTHNQAVIRDVQASGRPYVSPDLGKLLAGFGPLAYYLDFEAITPAIPLFPGTRPYQPIPFLWSLHRRDKRGRLAHSSFVGISGDQRRDFTESLIEALHGTADTPIIVCSSYERTRLRELAAEFPDLVAPIDGIIGRLKDLLPVVRGAVYHPDFNFSYSIKTVAPALCSGFGYDGLDITDGAAAAAMAERLLMGARWGDAIQPLVAYCERDTLALVEVHKALIALAEGA